MAAVSVCPNCPGKVRVRCRQRASRPIATAWALAPAALRPMTYLHAVKTVECPRSDRGVGTPTPGDPDGSLRRGAERRTTGPGGRTTARPARRARAGSRGGRAPRGSAGRRPSARVDRPQDEDRAAAETLRRRSVAEDQLTDGPAPAGIAVVEELGLAGERPPPRLDVERRIGEEIGRPGSIERPCGNKDRSVGLVDEADRDPSPLAAPPAARPETGEPGIRPEGLVDGGDALAAARRPGRDGRGPRTRLGRGVERIVRGGQRLRCQDLPSVATDGA